MPRGVSGSPRDFGSLSSGSNPGGAAIRPAPRGEAIKTSAIVLAAGEGKRLKSARPKVLHAAAGRPLLGHVVAALAPLGLSQRIVVVPKRGDEIAAALEATGLAEGLEYAVQGSPKGTGDAARIGLQALDRETERVLVTMGDSPLVSTDTFQRLLDAHAEAGAAATILTAEMPDPTGHGRIIRDEAGSVVAIVEERDATAEQLRLEEASAGTWVFEVAAFSRVIEKIGCDNAQGEYYLGDVVELLHDEGATVLAHMTDPVEVAGVNSRAQLADVTAVLRRRIAEQWMDRGVTITDPATTYIDAGVEIGQDATILPFSFLEGRTVVGPGAQIGPQTRLVDTSVGRDATVTFAVVRSSVIGDEASVGPFASLRPGTTLGRGARAGTFVETKNTTIGDDSKANHLAYLGDAEIGRGVNVGAGTITCNWDGREKHKTVIEDNAYIGSDTMLVAPTHIGRRAATGAGAVVRGDVPDDALAVGVPARVIEGRGDKMGAKPDHEPSERGE